MRTKHGYRGDVQSTESPLAVPHATTRRLAKLRSGISRCAGCLVLVVACISSAHASELDTAVQRILSTDADRDYGEFLAGECLTCHTPNGASAQSTGNTAATDADNIPVIHGANAEHLIRSLLEYQQNIRTNATMQSVANALGEAEIAALVRFLAVDS